MKKLSIILTLSAAVLASCTGALEKDEVEAGFAPAGAVPTVTDLQVTEVDEFAKTAVVTATFDGITDDMAAVEIGFLTSTSESFLNSTATMVEAENGTFSATVAVVPGITNYFVAMAATTGGACYTETVAYDVPDIPVYAKLAPSYSGTYYSWYGGSAANVVYVDVADDHKTITLYNWDPMVAGIAEPSLTVNSLVGTLDEEKLTITFTSATPPFFMLNFSDAGVVVFDEAGENPVSEFVVTLSPDCLKMVIPEYGLYSTSQNGFYDGWGGDAETASGPIVLVAD